MRLVIVALLAACGSSSDSTAPPAVARGSDAQPPPAKEHPLPAKAAWAPLTGKFLAARVHGHERPCAVSRDGRVACWGALSGRDAKRIEGGTPQLLVGVSGVTDVVSLFNVICVLFGDGTGGCIPAIEYAVAKRFEAAEIAASQTELCVRTREGRIGCYETHADESKLVLANGIAGATSLACVADGCCATTPKGPLCTGDGAPKPLDGAPATATRLAFDGYGGCALAGKGATCWGNAEALSRPSATGVAFLDRGPCVLDGAKLYCDGRVFDDVAHVHQDGVVHRDGSVSRVGTNWHGELGDGFSTYVTTPQRVPDLDDVVELRVAHSEVCAVRRDRTLECWGWVPRKQLGKIDGPLGSDGFSPCWMSAGKLHCRHAPDRPVTAWGAPKVATLELPATPSVWALDGETLCVGAGGKLRCRERVFHDDREPWVDVEPGEVAQIDDFDEGFAVRFADGRVGHLRLPHVELKDAKVKFFRLRDATRLASGNHEICVQQRSGEVSCWTAHKYSEPEVVPALTGATAIAAHTYHRCAIVNEEVMCGGRNNYGQLGRGSVHDALEEQPMLPVKLPAAPVQIGVAEDSTCALLKTGQVWCWGSDVNGVLGRGRLRAREGAGKVVGLGP